MYDVRLADLLYAKAQSEEEKLESTKRFYRKSLSLVHGFDMLFAILLVFFSCKIINVSLTLYRWFREFNTLLIWIDF